MYAICHQVCTLWNELIEHLVWGSEAGRSSLTTKLVNRWKNKEGNLKRHATLRPGAGQVAAIFSNSKFIFCGSRWGSVAVYSLYDGTLIRDLTPSEEGILRLIGGRGLVAAQSGRTVATVWSWSSKVVRRVADFNLQLKTEKWKTTLRR